MLKFIVYLRAQLLRSLEQYLADVATHYLDRDVLKLSDTLQWLITATSMERVESALTGMSIPPLTEKLFPDHWLLRIPMISGAISV